MVKDKKAMIRIIEASLSIVLIASVLIIVYSQQQKSPEKGNDIVNIEQEILLQIKEDNSLRNSVIAQDNESIKRAISSKIPENYNFSVAICDLSIYCMPSEVLSLDKNKELYVDETVITGNLTKYDPKKVRLFIWEK